MSPRSEIHSVCSDLKPRTTARHKGARVYRHGRVVSFQGDGDALPREIIDLKTLATSESSKWVDNVAFDVDNSWLMPIPWDDQICVFEPVPSLWLGRDDQGRVFVLPFLPDKVLSALTLAEVGTLHHHVTFALANAT